MTTTTIQVLVHWYRTWFIIGTQSIFLKWQKDQLRQIYRGQARRMVTKSV